jgi:hypothetical protein
VAEQLHFKLARLIERITRSSDHIWCWDRGKCWRCDCQTHWVEVNYQSRLCRGRCTREVDAEYFTACNQPRPGD